jgi:hypothetical protein
MESLCENQNSQSTDILSEIKGIAQEDNVNASKKESYGPGDDFCNKILDQNTCKENSEETSGIVGYESSNSNGDGLPVIGTEIKVGGEEESAVVLDEVEKGVLDEGNTDLTENKSLEDVENGGGDSDIRKSVENQEDGKNDEQSNTVEELQDAENLSVNNDDQGSQAADIIADQDLQDEHGSLNEATNMDVEETGNITNAEQEGSKEDEEMNLHGKDREVSGSEMPDRVTEDDLEENLSQDDEVSMNPSESNPNPGAEEDTSMNVSEGAEGEQSMDGEDQDMQVENTEKDGGETMDVSMANVDVRGGGGGGGGDESMEVASPSDQDPIGLMNDSEANKDTSGDEQMEVNESVDESGKPEDEMGDGMKIDENSKQMEEIDKSTKQAESEDSTTNQIEGIENDSAAKEKDSEHAEGSDKPESKDSSDVSVESKDEEAQSEKEKVVGEAEQSGSGETADEVKSNLESAPPDKEVSDTTAGDNKASNEMSGKDKDEEEVCIIPDTVLKVGAKDGDKPDEKDGQENSHTRCEKPAVTEIVEKPKPARKSSSTDKRAEPSYVAPVEPVVEYRHSRPQRQAAKRAETQIKVRLKGTVKVGFLVKIV